MTTDVAERELAPAEPQTEDAPPVEEESVAAAPVEEQPAEDPVAAIRAELELAKQQLQELQSRPQKSEAEIRAEAEAQLRQQAQQREAQRVAREEREARDRAEAQTLVRAALIEAQQTGEPTDPAAIAKITESYINKRYDQITQTTAGEVQNALLWLRQNLEDGKPSVELGPREQLYANQLLDNFQRVYASIDAQARKSLKDEGWISPEEKAAAIEGGVKAALDALKPKDNLQRVQGSVAAAGEMTVERWNNLSAQERKDPKNQAAYDQWLARPH